VAAAISPSSGPPGTEVQVTVTGFQPETEIDLALGKKGADYDIVASPRTNTEGGLTTRLAIPTSAEAGEEWVVVATTKDGAVEAVSNVFEATAPQYEPDVTISPTSGLPGTDVEVVARGFPPDSPVEIGIGRVDSEYDVIARAQTDQNGSVETRIAIPDFVEADDRWVIVVAAEQQPVKAVSGEFDVTEPATPTPTRSLFTRTNIYLIAIGDAGESGKEIGCGDSVIPVEVEIEPTVAPLTAALEELLSIEDREYGQSGLYNALYQSELTLDDVRIVDGEAVIELAGTLTIGGVCDEPRVRAQLRETALQYATVEEVSIFINGSPLDEVLQGATPTPTSTSTAPSTPTPTPSSTDLFTRTNIYLIAIGDAGESGKEIGCEDSVIPVEVEIEPTIAPLTAALRKLLGIKDREYGESGLYNALYQSNLTLEDVTIVDGEATIELSGTLTVGGVCDEPRVRAQLRETALQYATVDRVSILVDGTPLEELLNEDGE
jgi:spore germination protein GerM